MSFNSLTDPMLPRFRTICDDYAMGLTDDLIRILLIAITSIAAPVIGFGA
jgi:hypothetical protein